MFTRMARLARYARMQPMKIGRRFFALVAVLAIAWGSLWPLVSAAGPKSPEIPNFICTQAGFQPPHGVTFPVPAPDDHDKFHCPLCVVCADATLPAVAPSPAWIRSADAPLPQPAAAAPHHRYAARPPPSRAPPFFS